MTSEKVRENRLRRVAGRRGWTLSKSRRRDPLAVDYGIWTLTGPGRKAKTFPDLDAVEAFLNAFLNMPIPGRSAASEQPLTPSG
jgi:hypothetical protein